MEWFIDNICTPEVITGLVAIILVVIDFIITLVKTSKKAIVKKIESESGISTIDFSKYYFEYNGEKIYLDSVEIKKEE